MTFHNAEDDSIIGTATAASGSRASVTWSGLEEGTRYEWYAIVDDGEDTEQSDTLSFSTEASDEKPSESNMGIWLAGIALIIVLLLIAMVVLKKKGTGSEEKEPAEDSYEEMDFEEDEELFEEEVEEDFEPFEEDEELFEEEVEEDF